MPTPTSQEGVEEVTSNAYKAFNLNSKHSWGTESNALANKQYDVPYRATKIYDSGE